MEVQAVAAQVQYTFVLLPKAQSWRDAASTSHTRKRLKIDASSFELRAPTATSRPARPAPLLLSLTLAGGGSSGKLPEEPRATVRFSLANAAPCLQPADTC
jgi:hypothetical protein